MQPSSKMQVTKFTTNHNAHDAFFCRQIVMVVPTMGLRDPAIVTFMGLVNE